MACFRTQTSNRTIYKQHISHPIPITRHSSMEIIFTFKVNCFYAPNFEEVKGNIVFGLSVRPAVRHALGMSHNS